MQRSVDGRGNRALPESAERDTSPPSRLQTQRRDTHSPARAACPDTASRGPDSLMLPRSPPLPLIHKTSSSFSAERIGLRDLRTGISAAKVGDAKIRAQQVRAVAEQLRFAQAAGDLLIPTIFQISQLGFDLHGLLSVGRLRKDRSPGKAGVRGRARKAAVIILR